ncbi:MAG: hypothetical protein ABR616_18015 [Dermatophilaceae bacterium]|nr:hypothetical protein [Intrasporangiaceae bacterium]
MIKAIETRYAGCRFRSRLEARWAVFFDRVGIAWEYEPQGFHLGYRLMLHEGPGFQYLPDFWLPGLDVWVEVKGSLSPGEVLSLLEIAASLGVGDDGGCARDAGGKDLVVLGPVPDPTGEGQVAPTRLHMHKGNLHAAAFRFDAPGDRCVSNGPSEQIAADSGEVYFGPDTLGKMLLQGLRVEPFSSSINEGYTLARSARFEHGEAG